MLYRLIVLSGPLKGRRLTVERAPTTVGRDPACAIHLDDEEVALRHAVFEHNDSGLVVRDLGTMNRVLVNKREVREAHLRHGDEIEIGRTRFLVQALLQTEVETTAAEDGEEEPRRRMGATPRTLLLLLLFLLLFIAYQRWAARRAKPAAVSPSETPAAAVPNPPPAPIPPEPAPPVLPPQMEEELRSMRATLATIKETVEDLGTRTATPPAAPVSPAPPEPPAPSPDYTAWLAIETVEQVKLPQDDSPDEARLLRLRLRAAPGVTIEPEGVRMEVQLFIREEETQRIYPARVEVLVSPPEFEEGVLTNGGSAIATIQCRVPGAAGHLGRYYGFRLKLFYKDVLQAEVDRPRTLPADLWRETDGEPAPD
ncbi:MAG: FHA domain-containing protein [Kiritimatiellae bacterium]|nr:FHA domain-containing protein [Kiritimatiellia bacterium]